MTRAIALTVVCGLLAGTVQAQGIGQPVQTLPSPVATVDGSGSIALTGTFQSIWAQASPLGSRNGCLVVNEGTHVMYLFFGQLTSASTAASLPLNPATTAGQAGGSGTCATNAGGAIQDQVSVEGTQGDQFAAKRE